MAHLVEDTLPSRSSFRRADTWFYAFRLFLFVFGALVGGI
jgi:hypothetical protein